jgi:hypothetical protein
MSQTEISEASMGEVTKWYDLVNLGEQGRPGKDAQRLIDKFFKTVAVLSCKLRSRQTYSRGGEWKLEIETVSGMSWQDVGRKLREQLMCHAAQRCGCNYCRRYQKTKRGQRESKWVNASALAVLGDPTSLAELLRSPCGLDRFDRTVLADLLECAFSGEIQSSLYPLGRPKKMAARHCAAIARELYACWKATNRRLNICDRGHTDEMKDEAARAAIEAHRRNRDKSLFLDHPMNIVPDFSHVRELMERPAGRRMM